MSSDIDSHGNESVMLLLHPEWTKQVMPLRLSATVSTPKRRESGDCGGIPEMESRCKEQVQQVFSKLLWKASARMGTEGHRKLHP